MDTHERAALEHQNWIGYLTGVVGCSPGAIVRRTGGVVSILTGLPFDWLNQILLEHDDATTDELAGAVDWARAHGRDRKSTRLNSSHIQKSRMPSSA